MERIVIKKTVENGHCHDNFDRYFDMLERVVESTLCKHCLIDDDYKSCCDCVPFMNMRDSLIDDEIEHHCRIADELNRRKGVE